MKTQRSIGSSLAQTLICHPRKVLVLGGLFTLAVLAGLPRLRYVGDADATLPDGSPLTGEIRAVKRLFGSNDTAAFVIGGGSFAARLDSACRLVAKLRGDGDVLARSISGLGSLATKLLLNREGSLEVTRSDRLCGDLKLAEPEIIDGLGPQTAMLLGADGALVIYADLAIHNGAYLPFSERAARYMTEAAGGGATIRLTGQPSFLAAMQRYSQRMGLFFPLIMLVIGALHYEALRSMQAVTLPLLTGLLASLLTLGSMGWLGATLDEYSSTAPILILAVAAGHSVQLLKRYMEELATRCADGVVSRAANEDALLVTLTRMAPVLCAAVGTAALCLLSLALFDIKAIARFGLVASGGLLYSLAIELSLMPAVRAAFPPKRVVAGFGQLTPRWTRLLDRFRAFALHTTATRAVLLALPLLALIAWGASRLQLTASVMEPFSPTIPERLAIGELQRQHIGTFPLDLVLDSGAPENAFDPALLATANELERRLLANPNVAAVASPVSVMRFLKCRYTEQADCAQVQLTGRDEASQLWNLFSGPGDAYPLVDPDWRRLRLRAFVYDDNLVAMKPIETLVRDTAANLHGTVLLIGGPAIVAKTLGDGIFKATGSKVVIIIAISGLAGLLLFRSLLAGLLFMVPSAISATATYAFLGLTGTTLNIATASIAALAVGVGVDYLIYFTFRLRECLASGNTWEEALLRSYRSAGGASLCVATAVAGGYAVLMLSFGFRVHQWLGELIPLAIIAGLLATLAIYPLLLNLLRPGFLMSFSDRGE